MLKYIFVAHKIKTAKLEQKDQTSFQNEEMKNKC